MIGWHYTTVKNWERIRKTGLEVRPLKESNRRNCNVKNGIWVYKWQQTGQRLLGLMVERVCTYRTNALCELRVEYDRWASLQILLELEDGAIRNMCHDGFWDTANQHDLWHDREPFDLIMKPVPIQRITFHRDLTAPSWL